MYNALNWKSYNDETAGHLQAISATGPRCRIVIGTDTLSVGVDLPHCQDVVLVLENDEDADVDDIVQKLGRPGRHRNYVTDPRGIIYITRKMKQNAEQLVALNDPARVPAFAKLVTSSCVPDALDLIFGNPASDRPCTCTICSAQRIPITLDCSCSGCKPESVTVFKKQKRKALNLVPKKKRLSRRMRQHGAARFLGLRSTLGYDADPNTAWMLPFNVYLPDAAITAILDSFALLAEPDDGQDRLAALLKPYEFSHPHHKKIFDLLQDLVLEFRDIAAESNSKRAAKASAKTSQVADTESGVPKAKRAPTAYQLFLKASMETWKRENPGRDNEAYAEVRKLWQISPENPKRVNIQNGDTPTESGVVDIYDIDIPDISSDDDESSDESDQSESENNDLDSVL
ncbi:hypothetical protein HGRIS_002894 [Hohenbuehelia grisea]|uniref:Helicase C-terminal domain-containing protein n=1 Tax=Hohenbuehelia grisea TaxID=104357 RepID=A0ABR3JLV6_9AGAR